MAEAEQEQTISEPQVVPEGDIEVETLYNTRVFFGNTSSPDVDRQPWIIVVSREYAPDVKKKAKEYGVNDNEIGNIEGASDSYFNDDQDDRVTVLTYYYRDEETDTIWIVEGTENVLLREPEDTGLYNYPIAWLPWDEMMDSYHGFAAVTELVYNQHIVNVISTMAVASIMRNAFPTIVYDQNILKDGYNNAVGASIGVAGGYTDLKNVATVIEGANYSYEVDKIISYLVNTTRELNGANDVVMGNIKPENTSAIIAARKAATTPLGLVEMGLYQFIEDFARIAMDFMANYYGVRPVVVTDSETKEPRLEEFDFDAINTASFDLKIDVGGSSYWAETTEVQTLDNLFNKEMIDGIGYVDAMPSNAMPHKAKLLETLRKKEEEQKMLQQQQMVQQSIQKGGGGASSAPQGLEQGIAATPRDLAGIVSPDRINQVVSRQTAG